MSGGLVFRTCSEHLALCYPFLPAYRPRKGPGGRSTNTRSASHTCPIPERIDLRTTQGPCDRLVERCAFNEASLRLGRHPSRFPSSIPTQYRTLPFYGGGGISNIVEQIDKTIGAYGAWKVKLR